MLSKRGVVFHKNYTQGENGFTLAEAVICIAVLGVGVACTVGALTKMNQIASTSRNMTGASTAVMSQIDLFQSVGPFNPQSQTPPYDNANNPPTYDMRLGTHTIGYKDPSTGIAAPQWPVYRESARWTYANTGARTSASGFAAGDVGQLAYQIDTQSYWRLQTTAPTWATVPNGGMIILGTMTITVTDLNLFGTTPSSGPYRAVVTIKYDYLNHTQANGNPYIFSMSAIRASDS